MQGQRKIQKRNRVGVIYKVSLGDKFIIGSTINPKDREYAYIQDLKANRHCNKPLQNLFNSNKCKKLNFEILQPNILENILEAVEDIWIGSTCSKIQDCKKGLNIIDGSRIVFTEEIREKKRIAQKRALSLLSKEDWVERINKIQNSRMPKLKEIGRSISKSRQLNKKENWENNQIKPVIQETLSGEFIKIWSSAYQVQKELGYRSSHILSLCKNKPKFKSVKGFKWRFATINEIEEAKKQAAAKKPKK
jgi:hypothetical protein